MVAETLFKFSLALILLGFFYDLARNIYLVIVGKVMANKAVPFERILKKPKYKFLLIGDSTVVGTGAKNNRDSIAGRFAADFPEVSVINRGINGQKLGELAKNFNHKEFKKIDLLVIQIGGNDIVHPVRLWRTRSHLISLLKKATVISPRVIIFHSGNAGACPFWPWYLQSLMEYRTLIMRDIYQKVVADFPGVHYIDLYRDIRDDPFLPDIKKFYAPDLFHPSGFGYEVWYIEIREMMDRLAWDFGQVSLRNKFIRSVMKNSVVKKTKQIMRRARGSKFS